MHENKVSILMGVYNCADTLSSAIQSILCQSFKNWELIMCDDASVDETRQIAEGYAEKYPDRIIVLHNEKNMGLAASLNLCNKYATGEYLARMDGDDLSVESRLEKQATFLDDHQDYSLVGTYMRAFDETGEKQLIPIKMIPEKTDLPKFNPFHHATIMIRKAAFDSLGGYRVSPMTRRAEDVELWFRFFEAGYRGYNIPEPLYYVRENQITFNRRTLRHSFEASGVLFRGIKLLQLPLKYYVYCTKPIISQITPKSIKRLFREKMDKENKRDENP